MIEARDQAVQALYATEVVPGSAEVTALEGKAKRLVDGVLENLESLDLAIEAVAENWRMERMPAVDRAILRLGLYELRHTDTSSGVIISEAVRVATAYSTEKSGHFVNGLLGALVETERPDEN